MKVAAICHVHSNWSYDGSWTLEALRDRFRSRGYRVLMMTEHDRGFSGQRLEEYRRVCAQISCKEILVVPGIEYSDAQNKVHVLVWGPVPFLGEGLPTVDMLKGVTQANGVAVLAHPSRRDAWKTFEPAWAEHLLGIEAWNRKYDGWAPSKTAPALLRQHGAVPFVGLDFHTARQSFRMGMTLDLAGSTVDESAVIACVRERRCHATALGLPLGHALLVRGSGVLTWAEKGRRSAANLYKQSRMRLKKHQARGASAGRPV